MVHKFRVAPKKWEDEETHENSAGCLGDIDPLGIHWVSIGNIESYFQSKCHIYIIPGKKTIYVHGWIPTIAMKLHIYRIIYIHKSYTYKSHFICSSHIYIYLYYVYIYISKGLRQGESSPPRHATTPGVPGRRGHDQLWYRHGKSWDRSGAEDGGWRRSPGFQQFVPF